MAGSSFLTPHRDFGITIKIGKQTINDVMVSVQPVMESLLNAANYYEYTITDGERPDTLAFKLYEDERYDWIILVMNNIYDIWDQWPRNEAEMQSYLASKYGSNFDLHSTKHHLDVYGNIVPEDQSIDAVSYFRYETELNDEKRKIRILDAQFLPFFVRQYRQLIAEQANG